MKYLVIGGSGLIGSRFIELSKKGDKILSPAEKKLDITNGTSVAKYFEQNKDKFDVVINFAAYTNVDGAERQRGNKKGIVWRINVDGAKNVAEACQKYGKFLIHISTDFVFPGTKEKPGPYSESAKLPEKMGGIAWYGWTKLVGERKVKNANKYVAIVRTAYPFRAALYKQKLDFARNILSLYDDAKLYPMFADQKMTPVFIDDLVKVLKKIVRLKKGGVYHVVTSDSTTPYEFASYLLEKARGVKGVVKKGSMEDFLKAPGRTPRPSLGVLDSRKTQKILGMRFRTWKQVVNEFVRQLKE